MNSSTRAELRTDKEGPEDLNFLFLLASKESFHAPESKAELDSPRTSCGAGPMTRLSTFLSTFFESDLVAAAAFFLLALLSAHPYFSLPCRAYPTKASDGREVTPNERATNDVLVLPLGNHSLSVLAKNLT